MTTRALAIGAYVLALVIAVVVISTRRRRSTGLTIAILLLFALAGLALRAMAPHDWWAGGRIR